MLVEIENVRQVPGEDNRKWFVDENTDLIVWYDSSEERITGFQLCYDKKSVQRCLTWQLKEGGKTLLSADGRYSKRRVIRLFNSISAELPPDLKELVEEALN
ncbi:MULTISPECIES: hypothetical protein [unclassified Oceanispirochaeta]|uniref:hypothetical protein n=1 Tax=unclassified Oceanispirochaeta TaxID=2635722 RepID=UPI000E09809B|nr:MULTISPECIES: hypothetical protein [unclassified Oceanispirochaeta]MBF9017108.1 hypothetical protein [Oceanispirochaeta sp. M2]NPD73557.1 hypothetical protein [Oceanispirochaeta sp. M1]RDG30662.1 hypothetical protein DV872_15785 [Oceanispirochaeta sp. M1]